MTTRRTIKIVSVYAHDYGITTFNEGTTKLGALREMYALLEGVEAEQDMPEEDLEAACEAACSVFCISEQDIQVD